MSTIHAETMPCTCPTCGQSLTDKAILAAERATPTINTAGLTLRMAALLRFLDACEHDGWTPTLDAMAAFLGLKSMSGAHRLIVCLEKRGRVRRGPGVMARSVTVVR